MSRVLDGYPDAPPEVRAALAEALREVEGFSIPPVVLVPFRASRDSAAARLAWRAANPEESARYDALCARIDRLETEAQAPRTDVVDRELRRCGVPLKVLADMRGPKFDKTLEAISGTRGWAEVPRGQRRSCLVLSGARGVGKSCAAAWTASRFAAQRRWWQGQPSGSTPRSVFCWLHGPTVTTEAGFLADDVEARFDQALTAELLVLDDLEVKGGKTGLLKVASLLSQRFDSSRWTVVTTNAVLEQLAEALGSHVGDRLLASHVVACRSTVSLRTGRAA